MSNTIFWQKRLSAEFPQCVNPSPAEPGYVLPFANSVDLKKPTDMDLHCLPICMYLYQQSGSCNLIGLKLEMGMAS